MLLGKILSVRHVNVRLADTERSATVATVVLIISNENNCPSCQNRSCPEGWIRKALPWLPVGPGVCGAERTSPTPPFQTTLLVPGTLEFPPSGPKHVSPWGLPSSGQTCSYLCTLRPNGWPWVAVCEESGWNLEFGELDTHRCL